VTEATAPITTIRSFVDEKIAAGEINKENDNWRSTLPVFPEVDFSKDCCFTWVLDTSHGEIKVRLLHQNAPRHVANFLYLTELGYFDDLNFHRVIPEFMAQGGCPQGTGTGGPGYQFSGEFDGNEHHNRAGILSMANAGPGTDGSQFFLTFAHTPWLDGNHTIFGEVVEGIDNLKAIEKLGSPDGTPSEPIIISKATIEDV